MDGGGCHLSDPVTNGSSEQLSSLSLNCRKVQPISDKLEKNPRLIARKYQIDLCKKALTENVIVYLGTGCGKTHIAVLLIYEMGHLIKKPQKNICVFLAPTVDLVQQQAKVIEKSVDFKVGIYCGSSAHLKGRCNWEKEIEDYEVLVMTPQILLHTLLHCFIKIEMIALLIFDECHYAQLESHHPYSEIMKIFYKVDVAKLPRIFGMTASPKLRKGGSIDSLEALLHAKVYSVDDKDELEQFVTSPKVKVYYYGSIENGYSCPYTLYTRKIEEIKHLCTSELRLNTLDQRLRSNTTKLLQNLHSSIICCLENLGFWGALQASCIFLKGDQNEHIEEIEAGKNCGDDNLCKKYLQKTASVLTSDRMEDGMEADLSCVEVLREPFISRKLLQLIEILSNFRLQENMKCIIFVNRIIIARSLSYILRNLKPLASWKCDFLVGVNSKLVSRKNTNIILEKFLSGELNLLVATKVGEEGLDIQTCCLVIRFDLPETISSFIQSRGTAQMPQSEYAFLVDRGNPRELNLIEHFKKDEAQMNEEISSRKSPTPMAITGLEERTHKVDITGATISSVFSISLLHRYCSRLPHDEFFNPKPQFFYYDDVDGMVCNIILPANAPIRQIISAPQPSMDAAKRDACLKACKALHEVGALTEYLLSEQDNKHEEWTQDLSDSDSCDNEESRVELHKMLVPAAFTEPWTEIGNSICLSSYDIEFCPNPVDRIYRRFGLFVKKPLPEEAAKINLDLCLAHGRMVMTQLIPSGVSRFNEDEIASAERFQRMFLKVILDRYKFVSEYVSLEDDDIYESRSSTFYLLLPVIQHESNKISVDWMLVRRCLSSPIFRHPSNCLGNRISQLNSGLHLANGHRSLNDIMNSLVYVPCKKTFFFISDIFPEKNGYSSYDDSKNHVDHYTETFDIHLAYPDQPLLKAKQLFILENLLRKKGCSGQWLEKEEHFIELPPEICQLKIIGFSKDIGSSLSLLPSMMHRLENFLVALELKEKLFAAFPEGAEVTTDCILEALTTERCCEQFSLERLEVLGDAFLKFAVGRHLFLKYDALDEGQLAKKRSDIVSNSNLLKLATRNNLQVYIRDQSFDPNQFFSFGHPCPVTCKKETENNIHSRCNGKTNHAHAEVRCDKCHHWLHEKTIADVVEALTGAFIVDSGFKAAIAFLKWIGIQVDFIPSQIDNIYSGSSSFLPLANQMDLNSLENLLGYKFAHKGLLIQAFVHPSYNNHLGGCYQRLEFLGDAVLDYLITSYLYSVYPKLKPGHLTDLRSVSVNNISFANIAGRCSFHKFIICDSSVLCETMAKYVDSIGAPESVRGHIEEKTCPKVLGDLVESFVGALFLDTGFDLNHVWKIMLSLLDSILSFSKLQLNPLKELRELCQFYNWELQFSSSKEDGKFSVEAKIDEKTVSATACATSISRKAAIRMAASQVYECLKAQGYKSKSNSLEEVLKKSEKRKAKLIGFDEMTTSNYDLFSSPIRQAHFPHNWCNADPQGTGAPCTGLAKTSLYEICVANCWKPPIFKCFKETGPCHLKEFTYKVVLEIEEMPNKTFEFYGESRTRKKEAAEHAAQGALWYLKHEGYLWNKKQN